GEKRPGKAGEKPVQHGADKGTPQAPAETPPLPDSPPPSEQQLKKVAAENQQLLDQMAQDQAKFPVPGVKVNPALLAKQAEMQGVSNFLGNPLNEQAAKMAFQAGGFDAVNQLGQEISKNLPKGDSFEFRRQENTNKVRPVYSRNGYDISAGSFDVTG